MTLETLTVGTRGSKLSLIQAELVVRRLRLVQPSLRVKVKVIKTAGDRNPEKPLRQIKVKGIFEKELDQAVLGGRVDFAVHSMKDVPTALPARLKIVAVPPRETPHDVLIAKGGLKLRELRPGAVVGTSSPRREAQVKRIRSDLHVYPIRGNVDSRISKLEAKSPFEAIVVAEAGVRRLGLESKISERLPLEDFTPAPGQGALAIVASEDNSRVVEVLEKVNHQPSMAEVYAEREAIRLLGGGCKTPIGAVARIEKRPGRDSPMRLWLYLSLLSPDGKVKASASAEGELKDYVHVAAEAVEKILAEGGKDILKLWKDA